MEIKASQIVFQSMGQEWQMESSYKNRYEFVLYSNAENLSDKMDHKGLFQRSQTVIGIG